MAVDGGLRVGGSPEDLVFASLQQDVPPQSDLSVLAVLTVFEPHSVLAEPVGVDRTEIFEQVLGALL